ncbi:MAG TPA: STAS domain-containing protein [Baekduia sp.]|uniref:STAS domain-containing protein n=1 Tax=Baekduia sp. TaxID=2600305 RepID=UPI002D76A12D|nr:STAS domain-containing protein [Baekduia sp.]HET6505148.1 STAS domain-containing protein [Baekduia sp.]
MDGARDRPATIVVVVDEATELPLGRLDTRRVDARSLDALARLQLAARRRGWSLRIDDAPRALRELAALCGLADVLGLEPPRQPELGEQLGEDVVVQRGDPPV